MATFESWLQQFGLLLVYFNVLVDAAGLPLPSFPLLLLCGALQGKGGPAAWQVLLAALAGALTADLAWFALGRTYGRRILTLLCKVSLSPDSCVRQTESIYLRFGIKSLLVAKFVPGFAVIAASMAGQMRLPLRAFMLIDALGIALWSGLMVGTGALAGPLVNDVVDALKAFGKWGVATLAIALFAYVTWKWRQRRRARADLAIPRLSVEELRDLAGSERVPVLVDVRSPEIQALEGRLPGALSISVDAHDDAFNHLARDAHIVVYCGCPNEVSAVHLVKRLRSSGFKRAQPLAGGIDAWRQAGLPVEAHG